MNAWIMARLALAQFSETAPVAHYSRADVLIWGGILIAVVLVASFFIMLLRRRLKDGSAASPPDAGFSLSDLRAMRDRGEITPEEYEQTRANVIAKVKQRVAESKPKPKAQQGGDESPTDLAG